MDHLLHAESVDSTVLQHTLAQFREHDGYTSEIPPPNPTFHDVPAAAPRPNPTFNDGYEIPRCNPHPAFNDGYEIPVPGPSTASTSPPSLLRPLPPTPTHSSDPLSPCIQPRFPSTEDPLASLWTSPSLPDFEIPDPLQQQAPPLPPTGVEPPPPMPGLLPLAPPLLSSNVIHHLDQLDAHLQLDGGHVRITAPERIHLLQRLLKLLVNVAYMNSSQ